MICAIAADIAAALAAAAVGSLPGETIAAGAAPRFSHKAVAQTGPPQKTTHRTAPHWFTGGWGVAVIVALALTQDGGAAAGLRVVALGLLAAGVLIIRHVAA